MIILIDIDRYLIDIFDRRIMYRRCDRDELLGGAMAQKIKMVAFDVDGTFVNNDKEVPEENLELLKRLSKKNVKMVLSTGRMPVSAMDLTRDLGLGVHTSACNGASMYLNDGNENFAIRMCIAF